MSKTVFVGLSGGVDSSVTAYLLLEQGYDVRGVFMKNWSADVGDWHCPWREDYRDAKRVSVQLGIPLDLYDFQTEYKSKVVDYLISEYQAGRTPNPDMMCNQEIKFKLFTKTAFENGADMIATGHYAQTKDGKLFKGLDETKDQSYFLARVESEALQRTLFPLGDIKKSDVREIAAQKNLITATKKDSVGICFVGSVGIEAFLREFVEAEPGEIINQSGIVVGQHEGAIFYTIGQRKGLGIASELPYYVTKKDMKNNIVFVSNDIHDTELWVTSIASTDVHWITKPPVSNKTYKIRYRHLGPLVDGTVEETPEGFSVKFNEQQRAIASGQSAVVYDGNEVLGALTIS